MNRLFCVFALANQMYNAAAARVPLVGNSDPQSHVVSIVYGGVVTRIYR